jgi:hypothetical protein
VTERRIDPRNYLDLAGGREDIAVALEQQDRRHALRLRITHALPDATLPQLEAMAAAVKATGPLPVHDDEIEPGVHFEGSF